MAEANYTSGEDYVVEFLGYCFGFNTFDFEQRVVAAAVRLGLLAGNELDDDETADLVELVASPIGQIDEPRSALGFLFVLWTRIAVDTLRRQRHPGRIVAAGVSAFALLVVLSFFVDLPAGH